MQKEGMIHRQAPIDEWKNDFKRYVNALNIPRDDYNGIMEYIDELPPTQPKMANITVPIVVNLPDDWVEQIVNRLRSSTNDGDTINRQAAIDAVINESREVDSRYLISERIIHECDAVEALSLLPSAQPKMGKWKYVERWSTFECSLCGGDAIRNTFNYCPNCGAKMENDD